MYRDYNLLAPVDIDDIVLSPFRQALGTETIERMSKQLSNYDYYNGLQHTNMYSILVRARDLPQPAGVDYKPTRYATNYFKAIIDRKARWQMGGTHGISVPRNNVDGDDAINAEDYTPSAAQLAENKRAEGYEKLLYTLWKENKMRARLISAARDRLIADRVVCKIVFNPRTGRLHWVWVPDYEFIPVFSDDDFRDLIGGAFVKYRKYPYKGKDVDAVQIQRYKIEDDGYCSFEDAIYLLDDLRLIHTVTPKGSLGLDFLPIQIFPVNELLRESLGDSEITSIRELNDITNQLNEDATDSLKFEMFPMTAVINGPAGVADKIMKAPGATLEITGDGDRTPDVKVIESGFKWTTAFDAQYARVKAAMHEISGLPQIVPQELNFGGLNSEALQILFQDIITDTEEHWLSWGYNLSELHEKSARYLQAMINEPRFAYDKSVVRAIGNDYTNEMKFVLPLPDNRAELVELLTLEAASGFESTKGALERLGVENVQAKLQEIDGQAASARTAADPYNANEEVIA